MVTRVRFIGRIWKVGFLKDLMELFKGLCGEVRINSFVVNVPITDFDLFGDVEIENLKSAIVEILKRHGYSERRLLTVKRVEEIEVVEEKHERTLEDFMS